MEWFNYYGLAVICIIMIPNVICTFVDKSAFENYFHNKIIETMEQIGRFGCFACMIINVPFVCYGFWMENALAIYLITNGVLLTTYLLGWVIFDKKKQITKTLWLSIAPTIIFVFSGVALRHLPLIVFATLFGIAHITISYKNAVLRVNKHKSEH